MPRGRKNKVAEQMETSSEEKVLLEELNFIESDVFEFQSFLIACSDQLNSEQLSELKTRQSIAKPLYDQFRTLSCKLKSLGIFIPCEKEQSIKKCYIESISLSEVILAKNVSGELISNPIMSFNTTKQNIKLPSISLPDFNGCSEHWLNFKDTFTSLIHNNQDLSLIDKCHHLKACLKGQAKTIVENISITESNYLIMWDLLNQRYEDKTLLINTHIKAILNTNIMQKDSANSLRQIHETLNSNMRALQSLNIPVESWDSIINVIIYEKFDNNTKKAFDEYKFQFDLPTYQDLNEFLLQRCKFLEKSTIININNKQEHRTQIKSENKSHFQQPKQSTKYHIATIDNNLTNKCFHCNNNHKIYQCESFLALNAKARYDVIKSKNLCTNCLRNNHKSSECKSTYTCKHCKKPHNSLLHFDQNTINNSNHNNEPNQNISTNTNNVLASNSINSQVLLSTITVKIKNHSGKYVTARALLDNGSQSNLCTEHLCKTLRLPQTESNNTVSGINQSTSTLTKTTNIQVASCTSNYNTNISCLVIPNITGNLPSYSFSASALKIPSNIVLADPNFNKSGPIDLLLGNEICSKITLTTPQKLTGKNTPLLYNTKFGWVLTGLTRMPINSNLSTLSFLHIAHNAQECEEIKILNKQLSNFWNVDEITKSNKFLSPEETLCENSFQSTHYRDCSGRFYVQIPIKQDIKSIGNSYDMATKRFLHLENKLHNNKKLKLEYDNFINEYKLLGHMSRVKDTSLLPNIHFYFPHHAVIKDTSLTTKLRVVFDGSAKTNQGISFNDIQFKGPTIQDDLFNIIIRFRKHKFVVTADVKMMYRQVYIHPDQNNMQLIIWRDNRNKDLETYSLNTVTYGTTSAPFLATRCLVELGEQHKVSHPKASEIILNDFYVDDILTGAETIEELTDICKDVDNILSSAHFNLRKYLSNSSQLLDNITHSTKNPDQVLVLGQNDNNKTLGLIWNAFTDSIHIAIKSFHQNHIYTKRHILSVISSIYDPLGLISPVIIKAKLMMQELWIKSLSWDEPISDEIHTIWTEYLIDLQHLHKLQIPRNTIIDNPVHLELHGFSDASEKAFGAAIYIRSIDSENNIQVNLLCSKSRVAPLKRINLPRLELCAALLLSELITKVINALKLTFNKIFLWTDSKIVLAWLSSSPHKWKTFVANRIAQIQNLTDQTNWHHIPSEQNPADIITRGKTSTDIINNDMWWHGSSFMHTLNITDINNTNALPLDNLPEQSNQTIVCNIAEIPENSIFKLYSSFSKLTRIISWVYRFINNCKLKNKNKNHVSLTREELNCTIIKISIIAQKECFPQEYAALLAQQEIPKSSNLLKFSPFLLNYAIRVGGRLQNSTFSFEKQHPLILSANHPLSTLIMESEHKRALHCGAQALLNQTRQFFWIINGRNLAKKVIRNCIRCCKVNPPNQKPPLMGNLPSVRTTISPPFYKTGVDYAGPFLIKDRKLRGSKLIKAYVAVFICMVTKCIHIELLTDLTSDGFIAVLRRFSSRRGVPSDVYSDNGSNFKGAYHQLIELHNFLQNQNNQHSIQHKSSLQSVNWHFIPPNSPHFGGLWESAVKSIKVHLKRVVGDSKLTYEDLSTVLCQIEAILNSRPLSPISNDSNDFNALTPGHFLIGRPLTFINQNDYSDCSENALKRFQMLQLFTQRIWKRWSVEYVSELQARSKWNQQSKTKITIGDLVLIKNDNLPPMQWQLGRIVKLWPGSDNIIRVVDIKISSGIIIKRGITRIVVLPVHK